MHVGFQTISFGPILEENGRPMLEQIKDIGYEGVEIGQSLEQFGSADKLYGLLSKLKLKLLGLSGGSLEDRIVFARSMVEAENKAISKTEQEGMISGKVDTTTRYVRFVPGDKTFPYIYTTSWDDKICTEGMKEFALALHTHMFSPVQTAQEAKALLKKYPNLFFLPDTGHLTVAGEDVIKVLYNNYEQIIAIHLKDWTAEFGRSYQFYARGFGVPFGEGDVNLKEIMEFLTTNPSSIHRNRQQYKRWIIVEQDKVENPVTAAHHCREWLRTGFGI